MKRIKDKVDEIIEWMKVGPMLAQVHEIEISTEPYKGDLKEFN